MPRAKGNRSEFAGHREAQEVIQAIWQDFHLLAHIEVWHTGYYVRYLAYAAPPNEPGSALARRFKVERLYSDSRPAPHAMWTALWSLYQLLESERADAEATGQAPFEFLSL